MFNNKKEKKCGFSIAKLRNVFLFINYFNDRIPIFKRGTKISEKIKKSF